MELFSTILRWLFKNVRKDVFRALSGDSGSGEQLGEISGKYTLGLNDKHYSRIVLIFQAIYCSLTDVGNMRFASYRGKNADVYKALVSYSHCPELKGGRINLEARHPGYWELLLPPHLPSQTLSTHYLLSFSMNLALLRWPQGFLSTQFRSWAADVSSFTEYIWIRSLWLSESRCKELRNIKSFLFWDSGRRETFSLPTPK
jgi:hypothetical protein